MEKSFEITNEIMEKINRFAVEPLTPQQVYCFSVNLCDNDIDRDAEKFSDEALEKLAELFVGKTGIFDHDPKGAKQTARIFETAIIAAEGRLTRDGKPYKALQAKAYMVRTSANEDLIKEISGGIKKEVSVSCSVAKKICSVCGADKSASSCSHISGKSYGGKLCYVILDQPTDAYEWSFVAVPAQVSAGVTKKYEQRREESRQVSKLKNELIQIRAGLDMVREYLRGEMRRLSYFCKPYYTTEQIDSMTGDMDISRLLELQKKLRDWIADNSKTLKAEENSFITRHEQPEENNEYTI